MSAGNSSILYICARCAARTRPRRPPRSRTLTTSTTSTPSTTPAPPPSPPSSPSTTTPPPPTLTQSALSHYTDTLPPTPSQLSYAAHFFASNQPHFLFSAAHFRAFPASATPEVAFLGRSNVGKSSLLNALLNRTAKKLAFVSSKPGRTREMNAFGVGGEVVRERLDFWAREDQGGMGGGGVGGGAGAGAKKQREKSLEKQMMRGGVVIVDMPGYGKGSRAEWGKEITKYLSQRRQLRRAFLLIDAEHGLKAADEQILQILREAGTPHQVVLSKVDKIVWPNAKLPGPERMEKNLKRLREVCEGVRERVQPRDWRGVKALGEVLACSAEKAVDGHRRLGIDGVRWAVLQAAGLECDEHGRRRRVDASVFPELVEEKEEEEQAHLTRRPRRRGSVR